MNDELYTELTNHIKEYEGFLDLSTNVQVATLL